VFRFVANGRRSGDGHSASLRSAGHRDAILTTGMHGLPLLQVVAVGMLILANAFFVAAEFALVSTRDTRIEQLLANKVPGARAVRRLQQNIEYFLPAVQLGVTLCSLAIGWIGEPMAAGVVLGWINMLPHPVAYAQVYAHVTSVAAVAIGFCVITYFHVTIGELVPKSLALRRAEALAVAVAPPMLIFMQMARPALRLLKVSAAVLLRGFDIPMNERAAVHSPEELKLITTAARRLGLFPKFQEMLIHRAIELDDVPVREIMTPRQRIFSLPSNMPVEEASAQVIEHMNSRVPVYDETRGPEHIIGIVYSKDLSRLIFFRPRGQQRATGSTTAQPVPVEVSGEATATGTQRAANPQLGMPFMELRLRQVMRDVLVVPETKSALALLREFQKRRRQMAIVVDEYGSTVGLVTAEDAIEQLTGELEDEFDDHARPVLANAQGALVLEGSANLRDLETQMQWSLPRDGGVETLAGFMLTRLGHIPRPGESVEYDNRRLMVMEMEGRRIAKIQVVAIEKAGGVGEPAGK
jgi:putative hemolysin